MLEDINSVFSRRDDLVNAASVIAHKTKLYDDTPVYQTPRRMPEPINQEIERQCKLILEAMGVIKQSVSPWSAPVVPVRKPTGKLGYVLTIEA